MNMFSSNLLFENCKLVHGFAAAVATTATSTADIVSMKNHRKCVAIIQVLNGTTVTGSAITLLQSTAVAGTSAKALAFTKMWANLDCAATDTLVETAVTSNTFTTDATNAKILQYVIDIDVASMDHANGFDCVQVKCATSVATLTFSVQYLLYGSRYISAPQASAIID